jgi:DedD protein
VSKPLPVEPVPVPETGWVVQLGSFSSQQNAQRLADEVSGHGFSVFLMPLDRSGKKLYRVRVGPRDTREQATELAGRLAKVGYSGQVTR